MCSAFSDTSEIPSNGKISGRIGSCERAACAGDSGDLVSDVSIIDPNLNNKKTSENLIRGDKFPTHKKIVSVGDLGDNGHLADVFCVFCYFLSLCLLLPLVSIYDSDSYRILNAGPSRGCVSSLNPMGRRP